MTRTDGAAMPDNQIGLPPVRSGPVTVAVVRAAPVLFDTPRTLRKLAGLAADAAGRGAALVVFPEAFVGGYPKGHDFGVSLGVRTPEGRDEFRRSFEGAIEIPGPATDMGLGGQRDDSARGGAIEIPGPATDMIGAVARDHGLHLVVGVVERDGGTLYCTAAVFGPDGGLLCTHRKLVPTALERVVWGRGDGSTLPVVTTPLGKIGAVICWENYMPLLRTAIYAKGVELYCAITVDDRETWVPTVRDIALEGRCFVLSACQFVRRSDLPPGYPADRLPASQDVLIRGGSCVVGPLGELLAGPVYGEECVLTATLDRADLARAKFDLDVVGHYSRPDLFRLTVNEAAASPVAFTTTPGPAPPGHGPAASPLTLLGIPGRFAVLQAAARLGGPGVGDGGGRVQRHPDGRRGVGGVSAGRGPGRDAGRGRLAVPAGGRGHAVHARRRAGLAHGTGGGRGRRRVRRLDVRHRLPVRAGRRGPGGGRRPAGGRPLGRGAADVTAARVPVERPPGRPSVGKAQRSDEAGHPPSVNRYSRPSARSTT